MSASLLDRIRAAGIRLELRDGELVCTAPPGSLTVERKAWLKRHRSELLELLKARAAAAPVAPDDAVVDVRTASRGPCIYCRDPVTWSDGLKNWFAQLVHYRCAARWNEAALPGRTAV